jgi:hypothetical protein
MTDSSGVNWGLGLAQQNPANAFMEAYQQGTQQRRQNQARQAMATLVQNPNDPKALAALAEVDPSSAMQFRQQQIEYSKAQLAQHQDSILKGAEIVRQLKPKDQRGWDQARALAAQAGIDISQVPPDFNPEYVQGLTALADAFKPQAQSDVQLVPYQPGGGVLQFNKRTGATQDLIAPNPGTQAPGSPVQAGGLPHVSDQSSYDAVPPGSQYITPDGHIRIKQGGQPLAPAGGFR